MEISIEIYDEISMEISDEISMEISIEYFIEISAEMSVEISSEISGEISSEISTENGPPELSYYRHEIISEIMKKHIYLSRQRLRDCPIFRKVFSILTL